MGKRLPYTPNGQIVSALRRVWMRSRERAAALKRDGYTCQCCGKKQSKAKGKEVDVVVHHLDGINWTGKAEEIRRDVLQTPARLQTLCVDCHDAEHKKGGE